MLSAKTVSFYVLSFFVLEVFGVVVSDLIVSFIYCFNQKNYPNEANKPVLLHFRTPNEYDWSQNKQSFWLVELHSPMHINLSKRWRINSLKVTL